MDYHSLSHSRRDALIRNSAVSQARTTQMSQNNLETLSFVFTVNRWPTLIAHNVNYLSNKLYPSPTRNLAPWNVDAFMYSKNNLFNSIQASDIVCSVMHQVAGGKRTKQQVRLPKAYWISNWLFSASFISWIPLMLSVETPVLFSER